MTTKEDIIKSVKSGKISIDALIDHAYDLAVENHELKKSLASLENKISKRSLAAVREEIRKRNVGDPSRWVFGGLEAGRND